MSKEKQRPNILIVMTDHQRADTVLPELPAITPNLDKMLSEGVAFTNAFTPTAHCCPARASFMSGLYPSRHGVWNNVCNEQALSYGLNEGIKLWSEDLAESGYDMHYTGKWHVSIKTSPKDHGWKEYHVSGKNPNEHGMTWEQIKEQASLWNKAVSKRENGEIIRDGCPDYFLYNEVDNMDTHDKHVCGEAIDILDDLKNSAEPWCLFTGFIGPHDSYKIEKKYLDMYNIEDIELPINYSDKMEDKPGLYRRMRKVFEQLSENEVKEAILHFYAYCSFLDEQFGKILDKLDEIGQKDNTLVIYCADHGDYCGEHGLFAKGIPCFRGAYNVPAVFRWPQGIENPGRRIDDFVSLTDFAPTFLDIAGIDREQRFSGKSLLNFLRDEKIEDWRDATYTQCNGVELYVSQRSITTKEFKYTFNGFDFDELYDLKNDPDEMMNLSENIEYKEIKNSLCKKLWKFAAKENDSQSNTYITVGLAPVGPASAFTNTGEVDENI